MVTAALATAILVLAGATVLLFAMLGELNSRIPNAAGRGEKQPVRPLSDAPIGHLVAKWPAPLEHLHAGDRTVLLALSTACAACDQVAAKMLGARTDLFAGPIGVAVSCPSTETGEAFVERHGLFQLPHLVDAGGEWLRTEFGLTISPTAMVFESNRLRSSLLFTDLDSLAPALASPGPKSELKQ